MTLSGSSERAGKIVTFYSYKGGTGRSMALANVAWVLAGTGKRVLAMDWDLEAPGLHRYFEPFLADKSLQRSTGIIDFVRDFATAAVAAGSTASPEWYKEYANILAHAISIRWDFPAGGVLHLVPAGKQDPAYAVRVNSFDWQAFYERLGGGILLEAVKQNLRGVYDFILIDSRTGVSDTSGVCTIQMPDELVVCFTLNRQSIYGASSAARSAYRQRHTAAGEPTLKIWPIPARVESFEKDRLEFASTLARARFSGLVHQLNPEEEDIYWGEIAVGYEPYYAYEEVLATLRDRLRQTSSMLARMETIATYLNGSPLGGSETIDESKRAEGLAAFTMYSAQDFGQELTWLAEEYESIRRRMLSGDARTELMTRLAGRAQILGAQRDAAGMAKELFSRGTDGGRIIGLALARIDPQQQQIDLALSGIRETRSSFEQYHALHLAEALLPSLSSTACARLRSAITSQLGTTIQPSDPARWVVAQRLLAPEERRGRVGMRRARAPAAFMSYAYRDDQHEYSRLRQFRERLSGEVSLQTGEEFPIFQDSKDIAWGEQWQQRIDGSLDAATVLIPILTPAFFRSQACRAELERFLEREEQLGRHDLILPVYYVDTPLLYDEVKRESDPLAQVIGARQRADWREFRFEPFTSPQVGKMIAWMAQQIVQSLERGAPANRKEARADRAPDGPVARPRRARHPVVVKPTVEARNAPTAAAATPTGEEISARERGPAEKKEPRTLIVDALHRGDHATLTDALKAAEPGDRILIRPGIYREGVVIDKPVEIIGDGETGDVVIEANGKDTILFQANMARIVNLTLRQTGGETWCCVDIAQGRLDLDGCDVTSQSNACVAIHDGADPRLRRNRIHDGKQGGVSVYANGQGTLEDNEIFANTLAGVTISDGDNPTLRRNRIHDGKTGGVLVHLNGQGTLEDNEIFANALSGVEIKEGGNPTLRRDRIHDGKQNGVYVHENGQGILEDNEILANANAGVAVRKGGNPTLRRNRISGNGYEAVWVYEGGGGVFEDNDLRGNTKGAWDIAEDCEAKVTRMGNQE